MSQKASATLQRQSFVRPEVLFPGQTNDITKFLRYYAVSVDIYYYSAVVLPAEIYYHPSKSISRFFCRIFVNVTH